jgi:hypothetical protein
MTMTEFKTTTKTKNNSTIYYDVPRSTVDSKEESYGVRRIAAKQVNEQNYRRLTNKKQHWMIDHSKILAA